MLDLNPAAVDVDFNWCCMKSMLFVEECRDFCGVVVVVVVFFGASELVLVL